ncbi:hypothetical protein DM806_26015 [Sphingobium lactosutens]|nr:hypothetical protein [Sphingobium lactosutens]
MMNGYQHLGLDERRDIYRLVGTGRSVTESTHQASSEALFIAVDTQGSNLSRNRLYCRSVSSRCVKMCFLCFLGTDLRCVYFEYALLNCSTTERSHDIARAFRAVRRSHAVG